MQNSLVVTIKGNPPIYEKCGRKNEQLLEASVEYCFFMNINPVYGVYFKFRYFPFICK